MASGAVHADLVLFLCGWYREQLAGHPAYPGIVFADEAPGPNEPWPPWLVVFRDDGGRRTSILTADHDVGVTVYGGTSRTEHLAVGGLARLLLALAEQLPSTVRGNPVTALLQSTGPYRVTEDAPRTRFYSTFTVAVAATPI